MSRGGDYDYEENFPNEYAFWDHRVEQVLTGKRGLKALADLREALMALPEPRLISRALCTAGPLPEPYVTPGGRTIAPDYLQELKDQQGEGVCAVGAYIWHQKVKAGADPVEAMRELPWLDDDAYGIDDTARAGKAAGLSFTLAYTIADMNDETWATCTPEERWAKCLAWIDRKLAAS